MKVFYLSIILIITFIIFSCNKNSDVNKLDVIAKKSGISSKAISSLANTLISISNVSTSSTLTGWPASNLIDGKLSPSWSSVMHGNNFNSTEWISVSINIPSSINYIKLDPRYDGGNGALGFPIDFNIYYYANSTWVLINSYTNFPKPQNQPVIIPFASTIVTTAIKITASRLGSDNYDAIFQLAEISIGYDASFEHFKLVGNNGVSKQNRINNVMAGSFNPNKVSNWVDDDRYPIIYAKPGGFNNIYAPYAVSNGIAWNVYFGGWDGTTDYHDRISVSVTPDTFKTLNSHSIVIDNGLLNHVNNETVIKKSDGTWLMTYTGKSNSTALNKPYYSTSLNGVNWTPSSGSPNNNFLNMSGYSNWTNADVNGSNVVIYENGQYYLYFTDFTSTGNEYLHVHYPTSTDNINYTYKGYLEQRGVAQDVKKFTYNGINYYVMGLHINSENIYYSISNNLTNFSSTNIFFTEPNQYLTSMCFVTSNNNLYGVLYGGGSNPNLEHNSIRAKWLTKKIIFISDETSVPWGNNEKAHGPNQIILYMTTNIETGHFYVYDTDGITLLYTSPQVTIKSGDIWDYVQ